MNQKKYPKRTVAVFNNGNSVIVVDDGCYAIQNYGKGEWGWSAWIFPEALIELQKLSPIIK